MFRKIAESVTKGSQAPRNLDTNNKVIKEAEAKADSYLKIIKGWERNLPQIKKLARIIALTETYDYESKRYHIKRLVRKYGGDVRIVDSLLKEYAHS